MEEEVGKKCGVGGSRRRMLCRRKKEGEVLQKYGVGRSGRRMWCRRGM